MGAEPALSPKLDAELETMSLASHLSQALDKRQILQGARKSARPSCKGPSGQAGTKESHSFGTCYDLSELGSIFLSF